MGDNKGYEDVEMTAFKNPPPEENDDVVEIKPRKKSVSYGRKTSIVYSRGVSIEASSGKKLVKNIQRTESIHEPTENKVPLFRLNSIAQDLGTKEEGEEPERQQWDSPIEFLLSCISMSVGHFHVCWTFPCLLVPIHCL